MPPLVAPSRPLFSVGCHVAQRLGLPSSLIASSFFVWLLRCVPWHPGLPPALIALLSYGWLSRHDARRPGLPSPLIMPLPLVKPLLFGWLLRHVAQRPSLPPPLVMSLPGASASHHAAASCHAIALLFGWLSCCPAPWPPSPSCPTYTVNLIRLSRFPLFKVLVLHPLIIQGSSSATTSITTAALP
jgi:hypothetical protein